MSGGGGNPIQEFSDNVGAEADRVSRRFGANSTQDALLQLHTFGIAGVSEEGDLEFGGSVRAADEAIGEITGRNLQREALNRQTERIRAEEAERERLLELERERQELDDLRASRAAGARRNRAGGGGNAQTFNLGDQRDFLGI